MLSGAEGYRKHCQEHEAGRGNGMRYSEFKAEVEKLGFTYSNRCEKVSVDVDGQPVMDISTGSKYIVDNFWDEYQQLDETTQGQLFDLAFQLAKTPLAEREEEKQYWLQKIPVPLLDKEGEKKWLWKYMGTAPSNMFGVDTTKIDSELYKTIFTESEIAEMDITGFEKEPVE